jgi:hypothetical protein
MPTKAADLELFINNTDKMSVQELSPLLHSLEQYSTPEARMIIISGANQPAFDPTRCAA